MPRGQRNPNTIDWTNSESKAIVLDDLESGSISIDNSDTAEDLYYGMYQFTPEFITEGVKFEQFKARLRDHRKQVKDRMERSSWEMAALAHDRLMQPKKTHNIRGEKVFYLTPAYRLLAMDVAANKHQIMTPSELKLSRPEYAEWNLKLFDQRIRQAIRRKRFVNYLNDKREDKESERKGRRRTLGLPEETPLEQRQRMVEDMQGGSSLER